MITITKTMIMIINPCRTNLKHKVSYKYIAMSTFVNNDNVYPVLTIDSLQKRLKNDLDKFQTDNKEYVNKYLSQINKV